ncbi:DUF4148 domain-containing protein [Paraburkholderia fungorum]|uniref:DUF4148 domain-containing protein n=1 Tax=Paraburkholderia fungorum TaxID=134537 RepID=UPI0033139BC5
MKTRLVAVLFVLGTASLPVLAKHGNDFEHRAAARHVAASVGADPVATQSAGNVSAPAAPRGKTREEVRDELAQAYQDGLLPFRKNDYPPSAATIRRNKELYAVTHPDATRALAGAANPAAAQ